jgi:hypothetical protein
MIKMDALSIVARLGLADEKLAQSRLEICGKCQHYSNYRCGKCGCFMFIKARIKSLNCPIGLWGVFDKK